MIRAIRRWIYVKLEPVNSELPNTLGLVIPDRKKHFEHALRRGTVLSVGRLVKNVREGDVVVFRGDAGYSTDFDAQDTTGMGNENTHRWLAQTDVIALEEPKATVPVLEVAS